jgi:hypothetical protein
MVGKLYPRLPLSQSDPALVDQKDRPRVPPSLQFRVLRLGLLQDGDVGVGVFPEREEIFVMASALTRAASASAPRFLEAEKKQWRSCSLTLHPLNPFGKYTLREHYFGNGLIPVLGFSMSALRQY